MTRPHTFRSIATETDRDTRTVRAWYKKACDAMQIEDLGKLIDGTRHFSDSEREVMVCQMGEKPTPQKQSEPEQPSVTVEVGNHCTSLALPELPQTYSLEVLRTSEVIGFEDPLAVAAQFLQAADGLTTAMQSDIEKRQQRLNQTRQAKDEIAAKAQSLQLESRLYQLQTQQLDAATSAETSKLTRSLQQLKALGKQEPG